jgi:hypothetical protein
MKWTLKILIAISTLTFSQTGFSQADSTSNSKTIFTYSADVYYRYDLNDAPGKTNNLTSFTNSKNSFELGMASIKIDHSYKNIAATIDLGFGRRAQEFSYNDTGILTAIKQLYISYSPSSNIKLTMGKWATHIGYELLDAYTNRNYSMSYGFSYGPFFHTGLKADIGLGGKTAIMIGVANPTDFSSTSSANKVLLAQLSTGSKNDKIKAYLNFQGGVGFDQLDLVLNATLTQKLAINYDGTIKTVKVGTSKNSWTSNAIYLNFDPSELFGLTLRAEYFDDQKNVAGIGGNVFQTTLSGNIHLKNLTFIPEIRLDQSNKELFSKSDLNGSKTNTSFIAAAVYHF